MKSVPLGRRRYRFEALATLTIEFTEEDVEGRNTDTTAARRAALLLRTPEINLPSAVGAKAVGWRCGQIWKVSVSNVARRIY
jgi:hypothetical protein